VIEEMLKKGINNFIIMPGETEKMTMKTLFSTEQKPNEEEIPEVGILVEEKDEVNTPWRVLLFNDDIHTFDEVIIQLTKAIRCSPAKAKKLALKVHNEGKARVYEGDFEPCFEVNNILKEIQLITEIKG